jgi:XapX domain-containing protein
MKLVIGLLLAICVGIGCRWFGIPLPGPPAIMGAAMAVAMASGYTMTDYWLTKSASSNKSSVTTPATPTTASTTEAIAAGSPSRDHGNGMD